MHTTPRKILLAVTGISPQVVTETLYALGQQAPEHAFIPTEVHLVTTQTGKKIAMEGLLEKGHFQALLQDYPQLGQPRFDESHIHVIRDSAGQPLDDITSEEENTQAANTITRLMADLTSDAQSALHVSISGGRKTMGFFVGYAFSLFARPQDQLSHVLVSSPFESQPQFFFPPAQPRTLHIGGADVSTTNAHITLAAIPIVRLRHGQPQALLAGKVSYSDTVAAIQESLDPPRLIIDLRSQEVICDKKPFPLPPRELAWLTWWAQLNSEGIYPTRADFLRKDELRNSFLEIYKQVLGIKGPQKFKEYLEEQKVKHGTSLFKLLQDDAPEDHKKQFDTLNSKLKNHIKKQLPIAWEKYVPKNISKTYRLPITKESITIIWPDF